MPLLSIIIPSFNSLNVLQKCMDSIQNQSFKDFEVIVVDAASKDGTLDYLTTLKPPIFWVTEPDQGIYDAMNKGIDLANGEWLYFLGADDILYDSNILSFVFGSIIHDDISLIIGRVQYDSLGRNADKMNRVHNIFSLWSPKLWLKNTPHHQGIFYRKTVFEQFIYDVKFRVLADYDLNLKLFMSNYKPKLLDATIAICGADGISKKYEWDMYKEEIQLKTNQSSILLKPIFYVLVFGKYLLKKIL